VEGVESGRGGDLDVESEEWKEVPSQMLRPCENGVLNISDSMRELLYIMLNRISQWSSYNTSNTCSF
jgi:hypothetical protein